MLGERKPQWFAVYEVAIRQPLFLIKKIFIITLFESILKVHRVFIFD